MTGKQIREFFRELFGSRLVETMQNNMSLLLAEKEVSFNHLQEEMLRMRNDYEMRLQDKEAQLADFRSEKAMLVGKIHLYETTLLPLASRAGADVVAAGKPLRKPSFADFNIPPVKTRWQQIQEEHEASLRDEEQSNASAAGE